MTDIDLDKFLRGLYFFCILIVFAVIGIAIKTCGHS